MKIRVLMATIAGALVIFILGYLIYGILLASYLKENMIQYDGLNKAPTLDFVPLILSNVVKAFLLTFVFEYWARIRTFGAGLRGGAIIMFLVSLSTDLSFLGYMNLFRGFTPVIVDVLAETVRVALAGGAIAAVLGWKRAAGPQR
jgi:magnesium-transporting ATPase (P-type)